MGNRRLYKIERFHTPGTSESERLKVTALNLFHPTASPPFPENRIFPYCDTVSKGTRGNFKYLRLGFCFGCRDGSLNRNRLNPLNLLIHKGLHLCNMLFFQMRETALVFHVLTHGFILLRKILVLVDTILPFIEGPHPRVYC